METERYDIAAKLPDGATRSQFPKMLQTLLAERFHLTVHRATNELPAFALIVAKGGPRLKKTPPDAEGEGAGAAPGGGAALRSNTALDPKGVVTMTGPSGSTIKQTIVSEGLHLEIQRMTMAALAEYLGRFKAHPVTDMTGVPGAYDFVLELSREELADVLRASGQSMGGGDTGSAGLETASDPNIHSLANSLDLLGLRLEPRKASVEVLIIDHVERAPVEN